MSYQLSREAEQDILNIFLHTAEEFGMDQAERYHDKLAVCFEFLAENPSAAPLRPEISPPVRIHPIGAHIVVYTLDDVGCLFIIRVRHQHEDW
ncbi:type II toxin-antitoxin system RelE/ParE family toxin [Marinimicrobium sp. ARAG 43.8]|uniref:type II toxin-antitoxin system RelE/ParE family toxin n=1 Tax=Marinimicrobium sp. ARAG 43.8 TaxID=3418719 RepID=UPI003CF27A9A